MAIVVDRALRPDHADHAVAVPRFIGWPLITGAASVAAGAIHAAAIGVHSEHHQAVLVFTAVAATQLGWGALVLSLARPARPLVAVGALANAGFFAGWILAKTHGITFVEGLEVKERVQTADALAAALAIVAGLMAAASLLRLGERRLAGRPALVGVTAALVAMLAVPAMVSAGTHDHSRVGAHVGDTAEPGEVASAVPPKPYDPSLPIDLSGVDGVTPQEQARAENLLAVSIVRLPRFADPATAEAMGFVSIGDGFLGHEHYLNAANMNDDRILDPDYPESLVYDTSVTPKRLAAAMFMLHPGDTLADVPVLGGKLTQWHVHDNLCFAGAQVAGLTDVEGNCAPGLTKGAETPMIHVWIEPNACGPFAALEGVAGGTIALGEARLCDHAHGA